MKLAKILGVAMNQEADFEVRFTGRVIIAWGGMALMLRMLQGMKLSEAAKQWDLPQPCSNRGYEPLQLIEHFCSASGAAPTALRMPTSSAWMAHSPACLAGRGWLDTKPLCGSSTALIWQERASAGKNLLLAF